MSGSLKNVDRTALIICNGPLPDDAVMQNLARNEDLIICADGGANRAIAAGLNPDFAVGDFDSIKDSVRARFAASQLIHKPSQYATDLEKTLDYAISIGITRATLLGATGGRPDHQVCNLNILEKYSKRLQIRFIDSHGSGFFCHDSCEIPAGIGQTVSLFAFRKADGITTRGLKYPIRNSSMEWAVNDGLSNEIVSKPASLTVGSGCLLVYCVAQEMIAE